MHLLSPDLTLRILAAFDSAGKDTLHQVRTLHRLKAAGKEGVTIPEELRVVVTIRLSDPAASQPSPQSAAPSPQSP